MTPDLILDLDLNVTLADLLAGRGSGLDLATEVAGVREALAWAHGGASQVPLTAFGVALAGHHRNGGRLSPWPLAAVAAEYAYQEAGSGDDIDPDDVERWTRLGYHEVIPAPGKMSSFVDVVGPDNRPFRAAATEDGRVFVNGGGGLVPFEETANYPEFLLREGRAGPYAVKQEWIYGGTVPRHVVGERERQLKVMGVY